jgi:hypothetical protein
VRPERHDLEAVPGDGVEPVDERDVEDAVERGQTADGEVVKLPRRGSAEFDVERTARRLGEGNATLFQLATVFQLVSAPPPADQVRLV